MEYFCPYYNEPTQVRYIDFTTKTWKYGIAFQDYLIAGVDGDLIRLADFFREATDLNLDADAVLIELSWLDLTNSIKGD